LLANRRRACWEFVRPDLCFHGDQVTAPS
jgi:hypothetical protein